MSLIETPSPNHGPRPDDAVVDMLVLHYTGMRTAEDALRRLCDPAAEVSAHYLITEEGDIHALVPEERRAWHAGVAYWRGNQNINNRSIGIELVNPGHEFGYRPFTMVQMAVLRDLARDILSRHPIPARNVVGHADVSPIRKQDPGELFDWKGLAEAGIGLWPRFEHRGQGPRASLPASGSPAPQARPAFEGDIKLGQAVHIVPNLARYGYDVGDSDAAVQAFQRHFRQSRADGIADGETAGILENLLEQIQDIENSSAR